MLQSCCDERKSDETTVNTRVLCGSTRFGRTSTIAFDWKPIPERDET